jgi:uncharacterized protein (DUF2249 family)
MANSEQELELRKLPHAQRHQLIFQTYDALEAGQAFVIINDHDPKPLSYQMASIHGKDAFSWEYLEEGPEAWKVRIGKTG